MKNVLVTVEFTIEVPDDSLFLTAMGLSSTAKVGKQLVLSTSLAKPFTNEANHAQQESV